MLFAHKPTSETHPTLYFVVVFGRPWKSPHAEFHEMVINPDLSWFAIALVGLTRQCLGYAGAHTRLMQSSLG